MDTFIELGTRIAKEWSRSRRDTKALPEIAANELAKVALHRMVDYSSILNWVGSAETIPFQMNIDSSFGEPPITVFWHPDFYIEALFWASSTTSIHGHGFVGAFQVLAGASLQSLFRFDAPNVKRGRCRLGHLRQTGATLLKCGATQMIHGGEEFIHSVFHLGYPSVTIVVRTHGRSVGAQYDYLRPGVALPYRYETTFDQLTRRLLQVARLQAILESDDLLITVTRIGRQCDLAACFRLLETIQPILYKQRRVNVAGQVIASLAEAIGLRDVSSLAAALTIEQALNRLRVARETVTEDDLRLCLALLLTQQEREFVLPVVVDYTGLAEPFDRLATWICELGRRGILQVPTDEQARGLLRAWLGGRGSPMPDSLDVSATERVVKDFQQESLLAPLLRQEELVA